MRESLTGPTKAALRSSVGRGERLVKPSFGTIWTPKDPNGKPKILGSFGP